MQLGVKNPGVSSTVLFNGHINTRHPTLPAQGKRKKRRCENDIPIAWINKAVIDRRLRPRCCHPGSYFKRPKSCPVRPLARRWYYCAHFIAKPKAACALRFSWAATSSNLAYEQI